MKVLHITTNKEQKLYIYGRINYCDLYMPDAL